MGRGRNAWLAPLALVLLSWLGWSGRPVLAADPRPPDAATAPHATVRPDQAHGFRVPPRRPPGTALLWVPRGILFLPAAVIEAAAHPVHVGLVVYDKYTVANRLEDVFFNDARTFGAWPTAFFESGFGLNAGARLVHRDLGGHRERLFVRASFGGLYRQRYEASVDSGKLLGPRFKLRAEGGFRIVSRGRFFGYGNGDEVRHDEDAPLIHPLSGEIVESRYRRDEGRAAVLARIAIRDEVRILASQEMAWRRFSDARSGDGPQLREVFDPAEVTGYESGQLRAYSEAALVVNTLRYAGPHIPRSLPSRGWLARVSTGVGIGFAGDPSRFVRGGADVQRFVDLWRGNRVLRLHGLVDVVDAPFEGVTFVDLPTLGGPTLLRGYVRERFRGRIAGLGSVEYQWPIDRILGGFLFVDVGRVWTSLPLDLSAPRVGFGGGLNVRSRRAFFLRLQLASSIDGGFFLQLRFDPTWESDDDL
jgi:hypothetical protein